MLEFIPSPPSGVWYVGPVPIRGYALSIIAGILVAGWYADRRYQARGGKPTLIWDIALWAVPFGIVGGRIYHIITDYQLYFGPGRHPIDALKIWHGGLGIWGAVVLGGVGAAIGARQAGVRLAPIADALAPALLIAQGIGRLGNWFNQELFGRPTTLPWGVEIDPVHRLEGYYQYATFHPTFLYEMLWNFAMAAVLVLLDRKYKFNHARAFALYVMLYTAGRLWIEMMRIDTVNHIFGLRLNVWTSIIVFVGAATYFVWTRKLRNEPDPIERP